MGIDALPPHLSSEKKKTHTHLYGTRLKCAMYVLENVEEDLRA